MKLEAARPPPFASEEAPPAGQRARRHRRRAHARTTLPRRPPRQPRTARRRRRPRDQQPALIHHQQPRGKPLGARQGRRTSTAEEIRISASRRPRRAPSGSSEPSKTSRRSLTAAWTTASSRSTSTSSSTSRCKWPMQLPCWSRGGRVDQELPRPELPASLWPTSHGSTRCSLNLLVNAAQSLDPSERRQEDYRAHRHSQVNDEPSRSSVRRSADTGRGHSSESIRDKIFDPFFTTKGC